MLNTKIKWYVLDTMDGSLEYVPKKVHDEESYSSGETMVVKLQVWNNRYGDKDLDTINDAKLIIYFKSYEDNYLLNLCKIRIGDNETLEDLNIDVDRGIYNIGILSGMANSGSLSNKDNYKDIELVFGPIPNNIKSELKSLVVDIEY